MAVNDKTEKLVDKFNALSEDNKLYALAVVDALAYAESTMSSDNKKGTQGNEKTMQS